MRLLTLFFLTFSFSSVADQGLIEAAKIGATTHLKSLLSDPEVYINTIDEDEQVGGTALHWLPFMDTKTLWKS